MAFFTWLDQAQQSQRPRKKGSQPPAAVQALEPRRLLSGTPSVSALSVGTDKLVHGTIIDTGVTGATYHLDFDWDRNGTVDATVSNLTAASAGFAINVSDPYGTALFNVRVVRDTAGTTSGSSTGTSGSTNVGVWQAQSFAASSTGSGTSSSSGTTSSGTGTTSGSGSTSTGTTSSSTGSTSASGSTSSSGTGSGTGTSSTSSGYTPPTVTALSATTGTTAGGVSLTITGTNFSQVTAVMFGTVAATSFTVNSATSITAVTPAHAAGAVNVTIVTSMGVSTTALASQYTFQTPVSLPTVTAVSPGSAVATGGTTITITGTNFTGATAVSFGGVAASSFTVVNSTTITAVTPSHISGQVDVQVTTAAGTSAVSASDSLTFTVPVLPPVVTSLGTTVGTTLGGTSVVIQGSNFSNVTAVYFGNKLAKSFTVNSTSSITAVTDTASAGTVDVTVINSAGTSAVTTGDRFTFQSPAPTISGFSVNSGDTNGGDTVTITGTNFIGVTQVLFGTTAATSVTVNGPTSITVVTPAMTSTGAVNVTVTSPNGSSTSSVASQFTFTVPVPLITSVSATTGWTTGGDRITITGKNLFGANLSIGGLAAGNVQVSTDGRTVTATTPANVIGTVGITVLTPLGTVSAGQFSYIAPVNGTGNTGNVGNNAVDLSGPVVDGMSVNSASTAGSTPVVLYGLGFAQVQAVRFGDQSATFTINSDSSLTVVVPPQTNTGFVDIFLQTTDGKWHTSIGGQFEYYAANVPVISKAEPLGASTQANGLLSITGHNLSQASAVTIGGVSTKFNVISANQIVAFVPTGAAGSTVTVTTPAGTISSLSAATNSAISSQSQNAGTTPAATGTTGGGGQGALPSALNTSTPALGGAGANYTNGSPGLNSAMLAAQSTAANATTNPYSQSLQLPPDTFNLLAGVSYGSVAATPVDIQQFLANAPTLLQDPHWGTGAVSVSYTTTASTVTYGANGQMTVTPGTFSETITLNYSSTWVTTFGGYTAYSTEQDKGTYTINTNASGTSINFMFSHSMSGAISYVAPDGVTGYLSFGGTKSTETASETMSGSGPAQYKLATFGKSDGTYGALGTTGGGQATTYTFTSGQTNFNESGTATSGTYSASSKNHSDHGYYYVNTNSSGSGAATTDDQGTGSGSYGVDASGTVIKTGGSTSCSSTGSDTYFDKDDEASNTSSPDVGAVSGTTTQSGTKGFTDSGNDAYTASNTTTYTVTNGVGATSSTSQYQLSGSSTVHTYASGNVTQNETFNDGTVVSGSGNYSNSADENYSYSISDSTGTGFDNYQFTEDMSATTSGSGSGSVTLQTSNTDGTNSTVSISNNGNDQQQESVDDSVADNEVISANGKVDNYSFNQRPVDGDKWSENGKDYFVINVKTTGTTTAGVQVNDTENLTLDDTVKDNSQSTDPGTETANTSNPSGTVENDTLTTKVSDDEELKIHDVYSKKHKQTLADGTQITDNESDDDTDDLQLDSSGNDVNSETVTGSTGSASTTTSDSASGSFTDTDTFDRNDNSYYDVNIPVPGGTIDFGKFLSLTVNNGTLTDSDTYNDSTTPTGTSDQNSEQIKDAETDDGDNQNWFHYNVTDPTTGIQTKIDAQSDINDVDQVNDQDTINDQPNTPETEHVADKSNDTGQGTTGLSVSIFGSYSGVTTNVSFTVGDIINQQFNDNVVDDSTSPGNDTGTDNFSTAGTDTTSGGGFAKIFINTANSLGAINERIISLLSDNGTINTADGGSEGWGDTNNTLTSDNESDTETDSDNLNFSDGTTTSGTITTITTDPTTGLTITDNYVDNGSSDTVTINEIDSLSDGHTVGLGQNAADQVTSTANDGFTENVSPNGQDTTTITGTSTTGAIVNLTRTLQAGGSVTLGGTNLDNLQPTGVDVDKIISTLQASGAQSKLGWSGTITTPTSSGGTFVDTIKASFKSLLNDNVTDTETDVTTPGSGTTSTPSNSGSGTATNNWNVSDTGQAYDSSGNAVGAQQSFTDVGSDTATDTNGVISDVLADVSTTGNNPPSMSPPASVTVPIGGTPTGIKVSATSATGNALTYSVSGASGVSVDAQGNLSFTAPVFTCEDLSVTATDAVTGDSATAVLQINAVDSNSVTSCFAAGTPIRVPGGWKPIEEIRTGDYVLARDEHLADGPVVPRLVEYTFQAEGQLFELVINGRSIWTTPEHPFHVHGGGWAPAKDLTPGTRITSLDGPPLVVSDVRASLTFVKVFNMRVFDAHTYFVGEDDWGWAAWAHNECAADSNSGGLAEFYKNLLGQSGSLGSNVPNLLQNNSTFNSSFLGTSHLVPQLPMPGQSPTQGPSPITSTFSSADGHRVTSFAQDGSRSVATTDPVTGAVTVIDTSPAGRSVTSTYNSAGQLTGQIDLTGVRTTYTYDDAGDVATTTVTKTDGHVATTAYTYDSAGHVLTTTDAQGNVTTNTYDANGRLQSVTDPLGTTTHFTYDALGDRTSVIVTDAAGTAHVIDTAQFDASGRLTVDTAATGLITTYTYDSLGHVATVTATDPQAPAGSGTRTKAYTYDDAGDVLTLTDSRGGVTHFAYNRQHQVIAVTDPTGATTGYEVSPDGRVMAKIDALGQVTAYQYDAQGRLSAVTDPLGRVTHYAYDADSNLSAVTDPLGNVTHYTYNAANQRTATTDPLGNVHTDPVASLDTTVLDAGGRVVQSTSAAGAVTSYQYDGFGNAVAVTNALGQRTTYTYNAAGQVLTQTDPLGNTTAHQYNAFGEEVSTTDPAGRQTTMAYDASGNLITQTDANGNATHKTYDLDGRLTSLTDADGNTTTYTYDAVGHLLSDTNSLGASRTYTYDADGELLREVDRDGRIRTFAYDADGRRILEQWWDQGVAVETITTTYDADGHVLTTGDANSTETYTYDTQGNVATAESTGAGLPDVLLTATYNAAGERTSLSASINGVADFVNQYAYDNQGQLIEVTQAGPYGTAKRVDLAYDALGELTAMTRSADLLGAAQVATTTYSYDPNGQLTALAHQRADGTAINRYTFQYDATGALTTATSRDGTVNYTYDATHQLTGATGSAAAATDAQFTYDANGNRTNNGSVVGANNHVTSDGTRSYTYDAEGNRVAAVNLSTGERTTYQYDARNRLIAVNTFHADGTPASSVHYVYDTQDHLLSRAVDATGTGHFTTAQSFGYDGDTRILVFGTDGSLTNRLLTGPGLNNVLADDNLATGTTLWTLTNQVGTINDVITNDGTDVDRRVYSAFGRLLSSTAIAGTAAALDQNLFGYTGALADSTTGLTYDWHRWLDATTGTWLSQDPLSFSAGDANISRYVGNDPTRKVDPTGLADDPNEESLSWFGGRGLALLQTVGGFLEVVGGIALATGGTVTEAGSIGISTPVSAPAALGGFALVYDGLSNYTAGALTVWTGKQHRGFSSRTIEQGALTAGFPVEEAEAIGELGSMAIGFYTPASAAKLPLPKLKLTLPKLQTFNPFPSLKLPPAKDLDLLSEVPVPKFTQNAVAPHTHGPDVRTLNPVPDPARPVYKQGHAGQPVVDHIRARAAGGHPTDPSNLHVKPWEWNARKGAYEGQLLKARQKYIRQGLTPEQADAVLAQEWEWLMNDVLARPMDPNDLDNIPFPGSR